MKELFGLTVEWNGLEPGS